MRRGARGRVHGAAITHLIEAFAQRRVGRPARQAVQYGLGGREKLLGLAAHDVPDTWHQRRWGGEGMPRGAKGSRVRRASHVAPRELG